MLVAHCVCYLFIVGTTSFVLWFAKKKIPQSILGPSNCRDCCVLGGVYGGTYPYRITGIYPTTLVVVVVVPGLGAICTTNTLLSFIRNHVQLVAQFVLWFVIFFCNSAFNTVLYWLTPGSKSCTIRPRPYSPPLPPISMLGVGVCK